MFVPSQKFATNDLVIIKDNEYAQRKSIELNPYKVLSASRQGVIGWVYEIQSQVDKNTKYSYYEFALEHASDQFGRNLPLSHHLKGCSFGETGWAYCTCDQISSEKKKSQIDVGDEVQVNLQFSCIVNKVDKTTVEINGKLQEIRQFYVRSQSGCTHIVCEDEMKLLEKKNA